jgi:hypothetical protein
MNRWTAMKREGPQTAFACAVLIVAAMFASAPLSASTFLHTPFPELVRGADSVVAGKVLSVHSFWDEKGIVIVSEAAVFIEEQIAGAGPTVALVRTWGGTVNGFTVEAHGFPRLEKGDRVVLFLDHQADGTERIFGHQEGHYRLLRPRWRRARLPDGRRGRPFRRPARTGTLAATPRPRTALQPARARAGDRQPVTREAMS